MVYYGRDGELEFDFELAPGADADDIRLEFSGIDDLQIEASGNIACATPAGVITLRPPQIYQLDRGVRKEVRGEYILRSKNTVGFRIEKYEPLLAMVIDPVLSYSSYLGGSGGEAGWDITYDSQGNIYVLGATNSTDFPPMPLRAYKGNVDIFISKFSPAGNLIFSTYFGGSDEEYGPGLIKLDQSGNIIITCSTSSPDYPIENAYQPDISLKPAGPGKYPHEAVLTKLEPAGDEMIFSTYLGGQGADLAQGMALDNNGNIFISGYTASTDFDNKTTNALQPVNNGESDAFLAKFNANGALQYATYFGGKASEGNCRIAVDNEGNMILFGGTSSSNLRLVNPIRNIKARRSDTFLAKINPAGNDLVFSTYLGGNTDNIPGDIVVGPANDIYVTGEIAGATASVDFPVTDDAYQKTLKVVDNFGDDAFVARLSPAGKIRYATYFGGAGGDIGYSIALGNQGEIIIAGFTGSSDLNLEKPIQEKYAGGGDVFVSQFNPEGTALLFSTYFGGSNTEGGYIHLAVDADNGIYLTGSTRSTDLKPTDNAFQKNLKGVSDAFVVKIETGAEVCSDVWLARADLNASLPPSIRVFENCAIPAWLVQAAPLAGAWNFKTASSSSINPRGGRVWSKKTVSSFASSENALVAINAGFFGGSPVTSTSLVASGGALLAANIDIVSRDFADFRPTRATFGILDNGSMDFKWTYNVVNDKALYAYPQPAPNAPEMPAETPSSKFPEGSVVWKLREGIGGGPMLVMDGKVVIQTSWQHEVFFGGKGLNEKREEINIPPPVGNVGTRDPRTAMGITKNDTLLFVIADGRCADGSTPTNGRCKDGSDARRGMSHQEMAELMIKYRAIKAMNLDGGGSSALVVNGKLVNKPSDGKERSVTSAIVLAPIMTANAVAFDSGDECCYAEKGNWLENAGGSFFGSTPARLNEVGNGADRAVWRFPDITPGSYEVAAWWVPGSDRATNTPYTVFQSGVGKAAAGGLGKATATIRVNQSDPATAERWNILGTFKLAPGDSIVVTDDAVGNGSPSYVVADAVRLTAATGTGVARPVEVPAAFRLEPNYPNPFNRSTERSQRSPATTIRFNLPKSSRVEIAIYNLHGQQIRSLLSRTMVSGEHVVAWDGRNDAGELVASGVYFYRLQAGDPSASNSSTSSGQGFVQSRKMVFV